MRAKIERIIISALLKSDNANFLTLLTRHGLASSDFSEPMFRNIFDEFLKICSGRDCPTVINITSKLKPEDRTFAWQIHTENDFIPFSELESAFLNLKDLNKKEKLQNALSTAFNLNNSAQDTKAIKILTDALKEYSTNEKSILNAPDFAKKLLVEKSKERKPCVKTGFYKLDNNLSESGGFNPTSLNILAARPGVGKTSFAINITTNILKAGGNVLFFSLEQNIWDLGDKIVKSFSDKCATVDDFISNVSKISNTGLYISTEARLTTQVIENSIKSLSAKNKLDLVVIDYLGLLTPTVRSQNRAIEIGEMTRHLKIVALENSVPILLLSQLNRRSDQDDSIPRLSDLRDSGAIEQDGDSVIFITRDIKSNDKDCVISIAKNRHGRCCDIKYDFLGKTQTFSESQLKKS